MAPWNNVTTIKDPVTTVAALVGMCLGLYNLFHTRSLQRVRLRVIPKSSRIHGVGPAGEIAFKHDRSSFPSGEDDEVALSIEIVNLSNFTVTIDEVGLSSRWSKSRLSLSMPILRDGGSWPRILSPREAVTAGFHPRFSEANDVSKATVAYASTACGTTRFGKSRALSQFIRLVQKK